MIDRIKKLLDMTIQGKMYVEHTDTAYDREDVFLPPVIMNAKRAKEYILNQKPYVSEYTALTGYLRFCGNVMGDVFNRNGHENFAKLYENFYNKPIDRLCTFEWQHSVADFEKVIKIGINGIKEEIKKSKAKHTKISELEFLDGIDIIADAVIGWANKCSEAALQKAEETTDSTYKSNLLKLSKALKNVPQNPAQSFYEAVLTIYIIYAFVPDSIGTLDRYLYPFYVRDIGSGVLTKEDAKAYLQELFLMLQARISIQSDRFTRGGESHFCVGGYLPNGEDGFNEMSRLIIESLMELPIWIPQVTLRWTKKTPREVLHFMLDCERKDPNKRIAFTNDEKRIKCYTEICGFPFEKAVEYTTVGCNEPVFLGAMAGSNSKGNLLRSVETLFHKRSDEISNLDSFDEFYDIFEKEMFSDLEKICVIDDKFNSVRARDINCVSSLFFDGCIESAKNLTQGGCKYAIASPMLIGITNVIDSLITVKQFVFDEKVVTMKVLSEALKADWDNYEDLRSQIIKTGKFFGNDDDCSNGIAQRLYESFYKFLNGKKNIFGYQWLIGDLLGYNEHHKWFGEATKATPDGRHSGDLMKFGIGQSEGRDRNGPTALLNSIAKLDPNAISCGSTVTNVSLDEQLIKNDEYFEKTVDLFETFFKNGGVHFQITYVSKEDLIAAQKTPEKYQNLRVRVTGFSDYFVRLQESVQDDIIERTIQK